jgi:hypothetical protein
MFWEAGYIFFHYNVQDYKAKIVERGGYVVQDD